MDLDKELSTSIAKEYIKLMLDIKQKKKEADKLKEQLIEQMDLSETYEFSFDCGNGYWVEVGTVTNYELPEIPITVDVDESVVPKELFDEVFVTNIGMSRRGKKLLRRGDDFLRRLCIPKNKRTVKISCDKK